jgi:Tfp pilus assembly protein PilN
MKLRPLNFDFEPTLRVSGRMKFLLSFLFLVTVLVILSWSDARQTLALRKARTGRSGAVAEIAPAEIKRRTPEEMKQRAEEVSAVNRQVRQLNQAWDELFGDLRAFPNAAVGFLALEVNARTNSIQLVLVARNVETMADYAAWLSEKKSLGDVTITRHEQDSRGIRFTVDAKWLERR